MTKRNLKETLLLVENISGFLKQYFDGDKTHPRELGQEWQFRNFDIPKIGSIFVKNLKNKFSMEAKHSKFFLVIALQALKKRQLSRIKRRYVLLGFIILLNVVITSTKSFLERKDERKNLYI